MRPPEFTGGNDALSAGFDIARNTASMRPPEFTGGNSTRRARNSPATWSFNEAAGIHRRKRALSTEYLTRTNEASMRPPEFTGGNHPVQSVTTRNYPQLQ